MSQDKILNYDPLRLNRVENIIELQEITVSWDDNTKRISLFIPTSKLVGKTAEEVNLIYQRTFEAFNIPKNCAVVTAALIENTTKDLASRYTKIFVMNLAMVYFERLARGDGTDPEMEIVREHQPGELDDERDIAASQRLIIHLRSRTEADLISYFGRHPDVVTEFCREATVNLLGQVTLSILEEKGYDHVMTLEERASVIRQSSRWRWNDYLELAAERWASLVLNHINPAEMLFPNLQRIVRSGLDVLLRRSVDDVGKILQRITKKVIDDKELVLQISADGKEAKVKLPDGKEIIIKQPGEPLDSQDSMDTLMKYLLEPLKKGPKPDAKKKTKYREFAVAVNKKEDIARYLSNFAKEHIFSDWIKQLEFDWHYTDLRKGYDQKDVREAEQVLLKYQSDNKLSKTTRDHATSPLGVAQIIAAVQMNLRNSDGSLLSITTLNEWYRKGGGSRWKNRS